MLQRALMTFLKLLLLLNNLYVPCDKLNIPLFSDENIDLSRLEGNQNGCYVAKAVGRALELGLTEVCQHQPEDPIEYLAMWLKSYSARCEREKQVHLQNLILNPTNICSVWI